MQNGGSVDGSVAATIKDVFEITLGKVNIQAGNRRRLTLQVRYERASHIVFGIKVDAFDNDRSSFRHFCDLFKAFHLVEVVRFSICDA